MSDVSRLPGPMDHAWQWQRLGACRGMDSGVFFHPDGERNPSRARRTAQAKEVCRRCPVVEACLKWALESIEIEGVMGGLTHSERIELRSFVGRGSVTVRAATHDHR